MSAITFTLYGKVEPQGSKRGFVVPGKHGRKARAVVVDVQHVALRSFRADLRCEAMIAMQKMRLEQPMAGKHVPVELVIEFTFVRPASCPKQRVWPVVKPDADKCLRSSLDALTGVVYADDAQVVSVMMTKVYGPVEQVHVSARVMTEKASLF